MPTVEELIQAAVSAERERIGKTRTPFGDGWEWGAKSTRDQCAQIALDEKVSGETGTAEDAAYNQACEHIAARIRSLA